MRYYKYIDENGEVTQLEATTRYIHYDRYNDVVEITEEEYNEHIAALQQAFEESNLNL